MRLVKQSKTQDTQYINNSPSCLKLKVVAAAGFVWASQANDKMSPAIWLSRQISSVFKGLETRGRCRIIATATASNAG